MHWLDMRHVPTTDVTRFVVEQPFDTGRQALQGSHRHAHIGRHGFVDRQLFQSWCGSGLGQQLPELLQL
jgi:hypothetical protein